MAGGQFYLIAKTRLKIAWGKKTKIKKMILQTKPAALRQLSLRRQKRKFPRVLRTYCQLTIIQLFRLRTRGEMLFCHPALALWVFPAQKRARPMPQPKSRNF